VKAPEPCSQRRHPMLWTRAVSTPTIVISTATSRARTNQLSTEFFTNLGVLHTLYFLTRADSEKREVAVLLAVQVRICGTISIEGIRSHPSAKTALHIFQWTLVAIRPTNCWWSGVKGSTCGRDCSSGQTATRIGWGEVLNEAAVRDGARVDIMDDHKPTLK